MGNMNWLFIGASLVVDVILIIIIVYFVSKVQIDKFKNEQKNKADNVIQVANDKARDIEMEAKDKALKILQNSESEISRLRTELQREDERLQKRRTDLDGRIERLEQREPVINKRPSTLATPIRLKSQAPVVADRPRPAT